MFNRLLLTTFTAGLSLLACAPLQALERTRHVLLTPDGRQAGEQVAERADDGSITVRFRFKDNGRGPEFIEHIRLAADGLLQSYASQGKSTMGGPIDEHFSRQGGRAEWHSPVEQGSAAAGAPGLFIPIFGSFEIASISLRALSGRPGGALPLWPSGTLRQRVLDETTLQRGSQRLRVRLLAQTGLGLTPALYWATTDARPRLLAAIYPGWMTAIDDAWTASAPLLTARQRTAEQRLLKDMATSLRQPLPGLTVVRNARIFDSETAQLGALSDVMLLRGRITAVLPAGSARAAGDKSAPQAEPANEIDAAGRVMLPGLFDMHGHVDRWEGGLHLAAGVTTVRDLGNDNSKLQQMLDETSRGELLAPQIVPCGFLEGDSPNAARMGFVIQTLAEAKNAVDWYAQHGYPQLKIYNSFPRELVPDVVAHAHSRGMRVSGHVPVHMRAQDVVEQGFDELQHINQVLLNFLVTPDTDTRTLQRFYLPAEKVAGLDFDSPQVQAFLALLKQRGTVVDPTLVTFDFIRQRDGTLSEPYAAIASHLPPDLQRNLRSGGMDIPDDATAARYAASYAKMVDFVGRMYRAGIPLVAGTDAFAGFTLHAELALYVQAGLTPAQALQVATRNGALYSRTAADRGSIVPGKLADLVLVDGDPTTDIADIRRIALVITQGSVVSPSAVYRALGIAPFVQGEPVVRRSTPH